MRHFSSNSLGDVSAKYGNLLCSAEHGACLEARGRLNPVLPQGRRGGIHRVTGITRLLAWLKMSPGEQTITCG